MPMNSTSVGVAAILEEAGWKALSRLVQETDAHVALRIDDLLTEEERRPISAGSKIAAIKNMRARSPVGLFEAKTIADAYALIDQRRREQAEQLRRDGLDEGKA